MIMPDPSVLPVTGPRAFTSTQLSCQPPAATPSKVTSPRANIRGGGDARAARYTVRNGQRVEQTVFHKTWMRVSRFRSGNVSARGNARERH